jgi:ABC-type nickel/cobalt efflux system permease component RcnA
MSPPRRAALALIAVVAFGLSAAAPGASAHPLGNFSVNHLTTVSVSADHVSVRYVLDQAEIPTVQEDDLSPAEVLRRKRDEVERRLVLLVDGRRVALAPAGQPKLSFPSGAGGLKTTRVELPLRAVVDNPHRVELHDGTFPGRIGWKAVVSAPGDGTAVRTDAPNGDPTGGLRRYPKDLLTSPLDERDANFSVRPGNGTLVAPHAEGGGLAETRAESDGFAGLFEDAASGQGVLLLLLLAAFGWGALHALSPGHGKAMVAAYLVGTRGKARHAIALGATVTITHTIGVYALGVVTLGLSEYVLPEDLYPWLTLTSGLLVVLIGAGVLRARIRKARHHHAHHHDHGHDHEHGHDHHHEHDLSWKGLLGMGAAAGLIPCPSALVVLLAAISQHEVALGLLLITAFSLGLAGTLTGLGLVVVSARRWIPPRLAAGRLAAVLPAASALLIVGVGCVLTAKAVPGVV